MRTIMVHPSPFEKAFQNAKKGAVFHLLIHGLKWPAWLRDASPRVQLLEDGKGRCAPVKCEILDPWPNAPEYWPPEWAPGAAPNPNGIYGYGPPSR